MYFMILTSLTHRKVVRHMNPCILLLIAHAKHLPGSRTGKWIMQQLTFLITLPHKEPWISMQCILKLLLLYLCIVYTHPFDSGLLVNLRAFSLKRDLLCRMCVQYGKPATIIIWMNIWSQSQISTWLNPFPDIQEHGSISGLITLELLYQHRLCSSLSRAGTIKVYSKCPSRNEWMES